MASPFPGMDPYLEDPAFWPDFHASFITYGRDALADRLPPNYEVRINERVNLVELAANKVKRIEPDLAVNWREAAPTASAASPGIATLEPVTIPLLIEEDTRETYIEILHRPERTLVATLELLSPSNKEEPGRSAYLAKRNSLVRHDVHLVELDLLVGGQRLPLGGEYPPGNYYALIARSDRRPDCQVYAWTVRQPLPAIPIPLRGADPDAWLDLQAVFATTYERGRYRSALRYDASPPVTLRGKELRWIRKRAKTQ